MKAVANISDAFARLSARERLLLAAAVIIGLAMTAIYAVRLPGEAAARSAAARNERAAADLVEARSLAGNTGQTGDAADTLLARLTDLAAGHGLSVIDSRVNGPSLELRLSSQASSDVLAWAAAASDQAAPLEALSITRQASDLAVEASFSGWAH